MPISQINNNSLASGVPGTTKLPVGSVLQVVQATLAGSVSTASATPVDTGLSVTITPTSSSSKILVLFTHPAPIKGNAGADLTLILVRGVTTLVNYNDVLFTPGISNNYGTSIGGTYLDSPATTSATTYKTQMQNGQASGDQVYAQSSGPGSIIVMEIAA
jgi:hypothetical protein